MQRLLPGAVVLFATAVSGCALFERGAGTLTAWKQQTASDATLLPPMAAPAGSIELEIVFAERPADDPLLAETGLWQEVDTIGALGPKIRKSLLEYGIRAGHVSSTPPRALEALLGLSTDPAAGPNRGLVGRRIVLRSGGETELQASPLYPECTVTVPTSDGPEEKEFKNARCVFRVTVHREQEGWARLDFVPEIHHGRDGWRPMPTDSGQWAGRTSQRIHTLYSQRFSITLNTGEMAVLTADTTAKHSLGRHFFVGTGGEGPVQRVLVVRLADMARTETPYGQ